MARALVEEVVKLAESKGLIRVAAYTVVQAGNIPIFSAPGFAVLASCVSTYFVNAEEERKSQK